MIVTVSDSKLIQIHTSYVLHSGFPSSKTPLLPGRGPRLRWALTTRMMKDLMLAERLLLPTDLISRSSSIMAVSWASNAPNKHLHHHNHHHHHHLISLINKENIQEYGFYLQKYGCYVQLKMVSYVQLKSSRPLIEITFGVKGATHKRFVPTHSQPDVGAWASHAACAVNKKKANEFLAPSMGIYQLSS